MKLCTRCGLSKPNTEFYINRNGSLKAECKDCTKYFAILSCERNGKKQAPGAQKRRYRKEKLTADRGRTESSFNRKFTRHGLSLDQYHSLAESQDFLCAVCFEEPQPQNGRKGNVDNFVVDHDHQTNRVRGLLCWPCNAGLGHLRDNPEIGRQAASYLDHHHTFRSS